MKGESFSLVALYFAAFAFSVLLLIPILAAVSQYRGNYHILSTMTTAIVNFAYWQSAILHNLSFLSCCRISLCSRTGIGITAEFIISTSA